MIDVIGKGQKFRRISLHTDAVIAIKDYLKASGNRVEPEGPSKGMTIDRAKFEDLKDAFYELRGGDKKTGAPTRRTLEELGLKNVADDFQKTGIYKEGK